MGILEKITNTAESIVNSGAELIEDSIDYGEKLGNIAVDNAKATFDNISSDAAELYNNVVDTAKDTYDSIGDSIDNTLDEYKYEIEGAKNMLDDITTYHPFNPKLYYDKDYQKEYVNKMAGAADDAIKGVDLFTDIAGEGLEVIGDKISNTNIYGDGNIFSGTAGLGADIVGGAISGLGKIVKDPYDNVVSTYKDITDTSNRNDDSYEKEGLGFNSDEGIRLNEEITGEEKFSNMGKSISDLSEYGLRTIGSTLGISDSFSVDKRGDAYEPILKEGVDKNKFGILISEFESKFEDNNINYQRNSLQAKEEFPSYFGFTDGINKYIVDNLDTKLEGSEKEGAIKDLQYKYIKGLNKTEISKISKERDLYESSKYKNRIDGIENKNKELRTQYNQFLDSNLITKPGKTSSDLLRENQIKINKNSKTDKVNQVNNIYREQVVNKYNGLIKLNPNIISDVDLRKVYDTVTENELSRNKYFDELLLQSKNNKGLGNNTIIKNLKKLKEADNVADKYDRLTLEIWSNELKTNSDFREMSTGEKAEYIDNIVLSNLSTSEKSVYSHQEDYKLNLDQLLKTGQSGEHIINAVNAESVGEVGKELLQAAGYGIGVFGDFVTRGAKAVTDVSDYSLDRILNNSDDSLKINEYKLAAETRSITSTDNGLVYNTLGAITLNVDELFGMFGSVGQVSKFGGNIENATIKYASSLGRLTSTIAGKLNKVGNLGDKMFNTVKLGGKVINLVSNKVPTKAITSIVNKTNKTGKWALQSITTGAAANPTIDRINSEASNDSQQVFNAITDIFFDVGAFVGSTIGRKTINDILFDYRFSFGEGKEILNDFIVAYKDKTGESIKQLEAGKLLGGANKLVDGIMVRSDEGVKGKNQMYKFLSDNILEMDKNKLKKMVTSNGMGIEISDIFGLSNKSSQFADSLNTKMLKENSADYRGKRFSSLLKKTNLTTSEKTELKKLSKLYEIKTNKKLDDSLIKDIIENPKDHGKYIGATEAQIKGFKSAYDGFTGRITKFINGKGSLYGNTLSGVPKEAKAEINILLDKANKSFGTKTFKLKNRKLKDKIIELSEQYGDIKTKETISLYSSYGEVRIPKDEINKFLGVDLKEFEELYSKDKNVKFTFQTSDGLKDTDQVFNNVDGAATKIEFGLSDSILNKKQQAIIDRYRDEIKNAFSDTDENGELLLVKPRRGQEQYIDRYMERVLIKKFQGLVDGGMQVTIGQKLSGGDKSIKPDNREVYFLIRMAEDYFGDLLTSSKDKTLIDSIKTRIDNIKHEKGTVDYYKELADLYTGIHTNLGETVFKNPSDILKDGMNKEGYFNIAFGSPKIENEYRNHMLYLMPGKKIIDNYGSIKNYFNKTLTTKYGDRKQTVKGKTKIVKGPKFHALYKKDMSEFMSDIYEYGFKDEVGNIKDIDTTLKYLNIKGGYGDDTVESIREEMIKYFKLKKDDKILKSYDDVIEFISKQGDNKDLTNTFIKNFSYNFFNNIDGVTKILKDFNGTNDSIAQIAKLILSDKLIIGIAKKSFKDLIKESSLLKLLKNKYNNINAKIEYNLFNINNDIDKFTKILSSNDSTINLRELNGLIVELEKAKKKLVKSSKVSFENYVKDNFNIIGTIEGTKIVNNYRKKLVNNTVDLIPDGLPELKDTLSKLISDKKSLEKNVGLMQSLIKEIKVGFTTGNISNVSNKISKLKDGKIKDFLYGMIDKYKEAKINVELKGDIDDKLLRSNLSKYSQGIYSYEIFKRDNPVRFNINSIFTKQVNEESLESFNLFLKNHLGIKGGIGKKSYLDFNMAEFYNDNSKFRTWVDKFISNNKRSRYATGSSERKISHKDSLLSEYRKFIDEMFPVGDIKVKKDGKVIDITKEVRTGLYNDTSILDKLKRLRLVDTDKHVSYELSKEEYSFTNKEGKQIKGTRTISTINNKSGIIVPQQFIKMKYSRNADISKGINNARKSGTKGMDVRYVSGLESKNITKLFTLDDKGKKISLSKLINGSKTFNPTIDELYKTTEEDIKSIFKQANKGGKNQKEIREALQLNKGEIIVGGFGDKDGFGVIYKNDNIKFNKDVSIEDRGSILELAYFLEYSFQTGYHTDIKLPDNYLEKLLNKTHNSFNEFYDDVLSYGIDGKKTNILENTFVYNLSNGNKTIKEGTLLERAKGSLESAIKTVRKRESFNTYEKNLFDDVDRGLTGYVLKKVIKTNPEVTKALNLGDSILESIKKGNDNIYKIDEYYSALKENEVIEGEFNTVLNKHNDYNVDINKTIDVDLFKKIHDDYSRTYGGDLEDGSSYASKNLGIEMSEIRGHEFKEDIKTHIVGETNNNARTGGKNLVGFEEVKIDGKVINDTILIGEESLKLKGGYKPYGEGVTKKVTIGGREYEIIGEIEGLNTSSFKEAGSTAHESGDTITSGLSVITRFGLEYQEAFSHEIRKDIKVLYDDFISSLNNKEISNLGFGDINRFIESVVSGTGLGKYSDEVMNNKVENFLKDVNGLLTETKLEGQEMYAKRADHSLLETEISISSRSKLFKGLEKKQKIKIDELKEKLNIEDDSFKQKELISKLSYEQNILDNKDYKVIAYRFPVPSKYNPGVYNIKIDDTLSSEAIKAHPRSFFIKMESDFDGDHIFVSGIEDKYSKIIAEGIVGVEPNTAIKELRDIISNKKTNDYILAEQVDKGNIVKVSKKYSIVDSRLSAVEAKNSIGIVSAFMRSLGSILYYKEKGYLSNGVLVHDGIKAGDKLYSLSGKDRTLSKTLEDISKGFIFKGIDNNIMKLAKDNLDKDFIDLPNELKEFIKKGVNEKNKGYLIDDNYPELKGLYEGGMGDISLGKEFAKLGSSTLQTTLDFGNSGLSNFDKGWMKKMFESVGIKGDNILKVINIITDMSSNYKNPVYSTLKDTIRPLSNIRKLSGIHKDNMLYLHRGGDSTIDFKGIGDIMKDINYSSSIDFLIGSLGKELKWNDKQLNYFRNKFDNIYGGKVTNKDKLGKINFLTSEGRINLRSILELNGFEGSKGMINLLSTEDNILFNKFKETGKLSDSDSEALRIIESLYIKTISKDELKGLKKRWGVNSIYGISNLLSDDLLINYLKESDERAINKLSKYINYKSEEVSIKNIEDIISGLNKKLDEVNNSLSSDLRERGIDKDLIINNIKGQIDSYEKQINQSKSIQTLDEIKVDKLSNKINNSILNKPIDVKQPIQYNIEKIYSEENKAKLLGGKDYLKTIKTKGISLLIVSDLEKYAPELLSLYNRIADFSENFGTDHIARIANVLTGKVEKKIRTILGKGYFINRGNQGKDFVRIMKSTFQNSIAIRNGKYITSSKDKFIEDTINTYTSLEFKNGKPVYDIPYNDIELNDVLSKYYDEVNIKMIDYMNAYSDRYNGDITFKKIYNPSKKYIKTNGEKQYIDKQVKLDTNIIDDIIESSTGDGNLATNAYGWTDKDTMVEGLKNIGYDDGNIINRSSEIYGLMKKKESTTVSKFFGFFASIYYDLKYGKLSAIYNQGGLIMAASQMIPNLVEISKTIRNNSLLDDALLIQKKFKLLEAENTLTKGSASAGTGLDISVDDFLVGRFTHETIPDYLEKLNISRKVGESIGTETHRLYETVVNPLGGSDSLLDEVRRNAAISDAMDMFGIKSYGDFVSRIDEGGEGILDLFRNRVRHNYNGMGGGVGSSSELYRANKFTSYNNYSNDGNKYVRGFKQLMSGALGFLTNWSFHKVSTFVDKEQAGIKGIYKLFKGDFKGAGVELSDFYHYNRMLTELSMSGLGLFAKFEQYNRTEDYNNREKFIENFNNTLVSYEIVAGNMVENFKMAQSLNNDDTSSSIQYTMGNKMLSMARTLKLIGLSQGIYTNWHKLEGNGESKLDNLRTSIDQSLKYFGGSTVRFNALETINDGFTYESNKKGSSLLMLGVKSEEDLINDYIIKGKSFLYSQSDSSFIGAMFGLGKFDRIVDKKIISDIRESLNNDDKYRKTIELGFGGKGIVASDLVGDSNNVMSNEEIKRTGNIYRAMLYGRDNNIGIDGYKIQDGNKKYVTGPLEKGRTDLLKLFNSAKGKGIEEAFNNPNMSREEFKRGLFIAEQEGISMPTIISYIAFKRKSNLVRDYKYKGKEQYNKDIKDTNLLDNGLTKDEYTEKRFEQKVVTELWDMINGDMTLYQKVIGEYIDSKHSDSIIKFKNAYPEGSKSYTNLVNKMSAQSKIVNIQNTSERVGNIDSRLLNSKLALSLNGVPDTDKGNILVDRAIDMVRNSTLDKKRKIQLAVGMFENMKKSQLNELFKDPEFRKKNAVLLQKWVNLNYTLVEDAYDFDENKLSHKVNYSAYGSKNSKGRFSNSFRPNYKSQSFSGARPGFSKLTKPLQDFVNDKNYSKYLSKDPRGYINNIDSDIQVNPLSFGTMKDYYIYRVNKLFLQSEKRGTIKDTVNKTGLGITKKTVKFKKKKKFKIVSKDKGKITKAKKTVRTNLLFNSPFNYE